MPKVEFFLSSNVPMVEKLNLFYKCPKCKAQTVRDMNDVFERCLNCGWYRRIEGGT
jgi:DNA-directed RNA polymerase subunit RPC12/RpoP